MKTKIKFLIVSTLAILFITYLALNFDSKPILAAKKDDTPTLYIHGSSGTINSFGGMLARMESDQQTKKELILTISPTGEITQEGNYKVGSINPSIQILFEDNKNTIENQVIWLTKIMRYLKEHYQIDEVNLVGHSDGGIVGLTYLEEYTSDLTLPKVVKFIAIGSPFNSQIPLQKGETMEDVLTNEPEKQSSRYENFKANIDKIDKHLPILLIAGDENSDNQGDGTVPLADALSIYPVMVKSNDNVQKIIVTGENTGHSELHENREVDKLVEKFLWN
ncbi:Uncharacterized protein with an alpha/beta hydrolase fold [Pilibacter termitis]|uniref:Uncharacterized protein with an alpha/beta hydrolase fold n=1 Tax=Pilibacter termitis TaxID=263852 RepID=A0A1T4L4W3_9ENTE|nr:alpha/beta fold hydrolase [Pilibacter termitis]SJZ49765.1 Uncharacterized protein with an alpha/beta hydrolase fold [Pilibacter termitis]